MNRIVIFRIVTLGVTALLLEAASAWAGNTVSLPASGKGSVAGSAFLITNTANGSTNSRPFAITGSVSGKTAGGISGVATGTGSIGLYGAASGEDGIGVNALVSNLNSAAMYGSNMGSGYAGHFVLGGADADANSSALYAVASGGENAAGNYGSAGLFVIGNAANANAAVVVLTLGTGPALTAKNSGANGTHSGAYGSAGVFTISSQYNTDPALSSTTGGTGYAVSAENTNAKNGTAGFFYNTGASNKDAAVIAASAAGVGVSGETEKGQGVAGSATSGEGVDGYASAGGTGVNGSVSGNGVGIYGQSVDGTGYAASFQGGLGGSQSCSYDGGATWSCVSSKSAMNDLAAPNYAELLDRFDGMPVNYYRLKAAKVPERDLGPSAEDFHAAFGLGRDDKSIRDGNAYGVTLAVAQGLYRRLRADEATIAADRRQVAALQRQLDDQGAALAALRTAIARLAPPTLREARLAP